MKRYLLEIIRQKWRLLSVILMLLVVNVVLGVFVSAYQAPSLEDLQTKWAGLRLQAARAGQTDPVALHRQGAADLEKLKSRIPEKRQFARVLSDLLEAAAGSSVEVGTISYKPVEVKGEALLSYQLSLSVSGRYAGVKSYLADLQKNTELLVVDTIAFSNSDISVEKVVMDLRITVYLREGA